MVERETIMIFPSVFAFDQMKTKLWEDINNFLLERFSKSAYTLDILLNEIDILRRDKVRINSTIQKATSTFLNKLIY